jgi:hypothetical protein
LGLNERCDGPLNRVGLKMGVSPRDRDGTAARLRPPRRRRTRLIVIVSFLLTASRLHPCTPSSSEKFAAIKPLSGVAIQWVIRSLAVLFLSAYFLLWYR